MLIPKEEFLKIQEAVPISAINLVVVWENKILLVYRDNEPAKGQWWVPGGRVLKNEKLEDAVKRKIKDLGLKGEIIRQAATHEFICADLLNQIKSGIHHISTTYVVKILGEPKLLPGIKYRWVNQIKKDFHPYVKEVLIEAKAIG